LLPAALGTPCPLCGATLTNANAQLDHIVPRALGGTSTPDNGRIVCRSCNLRRGAQLGGRLVHQRRRRPSATSASPDRDATWHSRSW
jgi:5-methylcytosine-specific restriction endonuclease McrA